MLGPALVPGSRKLRGAFHLARLGVRAETRPRGLVAGTHERADGTPSARSPLSAGLSVAAQPSGGPPLRLSARGSSVARRSRLASFGIMFRFSHQPASAGPTGRRAAGSKLRLTGFVAPVCTALLLAVAAPAGATKVKGQLANFRELVNPVWQEAKDPKRHGYSFREIVPTVPAQFRRLFPRRSALLRWPLRSRRRIASRCSSGWGVGGRLR